MIEAKQDGYTIHDITGAEIAWRATPEDAALAFRRLNAAHLWRQVSTGARMGRKLHSPLSAPRESYKTAFFALDGCVCVNARGAA